MLQLQNDTEIFVTGHSLGAALSVLCGIRLALKFPKHNIQVINFGCPKVRGFSNPLTNLPSPHPDPDLSPTPSPLPSLPQARWATRRSGSS